MTSAAKEEECDVCAYAIDPEIINFGALPPLPDGFHVAWHPALEHYVGHGFDGWESLITCNRFQARDFCIERAEGYR